MNSVEKAQALAEAMLRTGESFDGVLGAVQGILGITKMQAPDVPVTVALGLTDDAAALDDELVGVVGFILWLRSDDAAPIDLDAIGTMPDAIGQLLGEAGLLSS